MSLLSVIDDLHLAAAAPQQVKVFGEAEPALVHRLLRVVVDFVRSFLELFQDDFQLWPVLVTRLPDGKI